MYLINIEITNSANDYVIHKSFLLDSEKEATDILTKEKADIEEWNYNTPGAMSYRDLTDAITTDFSKLTLNDLNNLKLPDVIKILNSLKT